MSASRAILCMVLAVAVAGVVHAADKKDAPTGGTVRGTLVSKTDNTLMVRAEGQQAARRYIIASPGAKFDAKTAAFFRDLPVGSEVELTLRADRRNVANVLLLAGPAQRYLPQRIVGAKDELDKDVLRAIVKAKVGDRVEAMWFHDGERRMCSLKPAAAAE